MEYNKKKLIDLLLSDKKSNKQKSFETGVSDNMIGRLERGESIPSLESLPIWAKRYKKDFNYFFDIETTKTEAEEVKITDANEFLLTRFEEVVRENAEMKIKIEMYEKSSRAEYTMPDVPTYSAAEPKKELRHK